MDEHLTIEIINIKEENKSRSYIPNWDLPISAYVGRKIKTSFKLDFKGDILTTEINLKESPLSNPFKIKKESERDSVLEKYQTYIDSELEDPMGGASNEIDKLVRTLIYEKTLRLACWCAPKKCHAEIIAHYIVKRVQEYYRLEGATAPPKVFVEYIPTRKEPKTRQKFVQIQTSNDAIENLQKECANCQKCELHSERIHSVWSRGDNKSRLMIVGEAPGKTENESGLPFIGDSGKMLEAMLYSVGLSSQDCIIINAVKCRPPDNRNPTSKEVDSCWVYLQHQIAYYRPSVILALGNISTRRLIGIGDFKITHQRGEKYPLDMSRWKLDPNDVNNKELLAYLPRVVVIPTFHPAYLLRNPGLSPGLPRWQAWQDMITTKTTLTINNY